MKNKETIAIAGNTEVPIYLAIKQLGFSIMKELKKDDSEWWIAENGEIKIIGGNLSEVLSLISMRDIRGSSWKASDAQIDEYLSNYYPDGSE